MQKKRSKSSNAIQAKKVEDPGFNKLQPTLDLSAIVEKAPVEGCSQSGESSVLPSDVLNERSRCIFSGDLRFKDFNRTSASADLMG